jgi:hypothetical protein
LRLGVVARLADINNYFTAQVAIFGTSAELRILKKIAGVTDTLDSSSNTLGVPLPTIAEWASIRLAVDSAGRWAVWVSEPGSVLGDPIMRGESSALAAGGALAAGFSGILDYAGDATAITRNYENFAAWTPPADAAVFASQSLQFRHDQVIREDAAGQIWTPVSRHEGDLLTIPPSGREQQPVRFMVKAQRNHPEWGSDPAIDDLSARLFTTRRWLTVPVPD